MPSVELLATYLITPTTRLHITGWLGMAALAWLVWRGQKNAGGFWRWLFPSALYFHPSNIVDIKLTTLNITLGLLGVFSYISTGAVAAAWVANTLGSVEPIEWSTGRLAALAIAFALIADFCTYWVHRFHHEVMWLWPFHKLHHSAEVLTPFTLYRKHPLYDFVSSLVEGLFFGLFSGVLLAFLPGGLSVWEIGGVNAAVVLFNIIGGNLRHSHIWLHFGKLGYIISSPAMHQIHHSTAPRHYNKNYAEMFSVWDWLFGTLYLPSEKEELQFGLTTSKGDLIPQPHPTLRAALLVPFRESAKAFRKSFFK